MDGSLRKTIRRAPQALAVFLVLHGVAHGVGTAESFESAAEGSAVGYLGGLWSLSDPALLRTIGVLWALVAVAYLVPAWGYWGAASWRRRALVAVTVPSLALSVVALWAAVLGVAIDGLLLAFAWVTRQREVATARAATGTTERPRAA